MLRQVYASLAACGELAAAAAAQAGAAQVASEAYALDQSGTAGKHLVNSALKTSQALTEAGVPCTELDELLAVLRRNAHSPELQVMACKAVHGHLKTNGNRISQRAATDVLTAVLAGIEEHAAHLELQLTASRLLADVLASAAPGAAYEPLAAKAAATVLQACIRFARGGDVCEKLQQAFVRISADLPAEAAQDILKSHGPDSEPLHWVKAASMSQGSPSLQKNIFRCASRLLNQGFGPTLAEMGAAELVVEAMRRYPLDVGLQRAACEVLAGIAWCDTDCAVRAGGLEATMQALRLHQPYAWVCMAALQSLLVICMKHKQELPHLADLWDLTMGALRQHPKSQRVVQTANDVLQALSSSEKKQELYLLNQSGNSVTRSPRKSWHGGLSPACAKCQQGDVMQSRFRLNSKKIGGGL
ncbi:unnamed protein product [Symbiodinium natans]|uniref:Uncharacterized protein n=1 Tax=Symbiodinium natans TaxID=878477 RepID=A0A812TFP1_9DINO|nr:unnamed protein product [Symbiodinium natans]